MFLLTRTTQTQDTWARHVSRLCSWPVMSPESDRRGIWSGRATDTVLPRSSQTLSWGSFEVERTLKIRQRKISHWKERSFTGKRTFKIKTEKSLFLNGLFFKKKHQKKWNLSKTHAATKPFRALSIDRSISTIRPRLRFRLKVKAPGMDKWFWYEPPSPGEKETDGGGGGGLKGEWMW